MLNQEAFERACRIVTRDWALRTWDAIISKHPGFFDGYPRERNGPIDDDEKVLILRKGYALGILKGDVRDAGLPETGRGGRRCVDGGRMTVGVWLYCVSSMWTHGFRVVDLVDPADLALLRHIDGRRCPHLGKGVEAQVSVLDDAFFASRDRGEGKSVRALLRRYRDTAPSGSRAAKLGEVIAEVLG